MAETFSKRVARLMGERGWKQAELARRAKMSPTQVSRIVSGNRGEEPQWESTVKPLAAAFEVSPVYLRDGIDEGPTASPLELAKRGRTYSKETLAYAISLRDLLETLTVEQIRDLLDNHEIRVRKPGPDAIPARASLIREAIAHGAPSATEQRALEYLVKHPKYDVLAEDVRSDPEYWRSEYAIAIKRLEGETFGTRRHRQREDERLPKLLPPGTPKPRKKKPRVDAKKKHSA